MKILFALLLSFLGGALAHAESQPLDVTASIKKDYVDVSESEPARLGETSVKAIIRNTSKSEIVLAMATCGFGDWKIDNKAIAIAPQTCAKGTTKTVRLPAGDTTTVTIPLTVRSEIAEDIHFHLSYSAHRALFSSSPAAHGPDSELVEGAPFSSNMVIVHTRQPSAH